MLSVVLREKYESRKRSMSLEMVVWGQYELRKNNMTYETRAEYDNNLNFHTPESPFIP